MEPLSIPDGLTLEGVPGEVQMWCVAKIPRFVTSVLARWQRNYGPLPAEFCLVLCPQMEVSALGGLPGEVRELTDPRLRCRHFTGCHRPYLVLILTGPDADRHRREAQRHLPWSEGYAASLTPDGVRLQFRDAVEEIEGVEPEPPAPDRFRSLVADGGLVRILA